jgi:L-tyrosine isonitrile synthase
MNVCKALSPVVAESVPYSSSAVLNNSNNTVNCGAADSTVSALTPWWPAPSGSPGTAQHQKLNPEKVLKSFNSRAFRREQPSDQHLMLEIISEAIAAAAPLQFVLYWGKGPRCAIDGPDIECLDFLASFARRVREGFEPGAAIKLMFTDTHAELNGHSTADIRGYFGDIEAEARKRGFDACWLSELTRKVETVVGPIDDEMPKHLGARLAASAKKWYRGEGTAEDGARKYYRINMLEWRAVELAFPRSIFITYNSPDFRDLCPARLPVFYMYTLRRGYRIKPWFLPISAIP